MVLFPPTHSSLFLAWFFWLLLLLCLPVGSWELKKAPWIRSQILNPHSDDFSCFPLCWKKGPNTELSLALEHIYLRIIIFFFLNKDNFNNIKSCQHRKCHVRVWCDNHRVVCFKFLTPQSLGSALLQVNCYENTEGAISVQDSFECLLKAWFTLCPF